MVHLILTSHNWADSSYIQVHSPCGVQQRETVVAPAIFKLLHIFLHWLSRYSNYTATPKTLIVFPRANLSDGIVWIFLTLTNPCCNHIFSFYSYCKTILCVKECFLFLSFWTSTLIGAGAAIILTKKQSHQIQNWRELQLYSCLIQILTVGLLCVATRGGQLIPWVCVCVCMLLVCVCVTFTCQILVVILL